jgi:DNA-binding IclR family transcriptional regulator
MSTAPARRNRAAPVPSRAAPPQAAPPQAAPPQAAPPQAAPPQAAPPQAAPPQAAPPQAAPPQAAPPQAAPPQAAPPQAAPPQGAPFPAVPSSAVPSSAVPSSAAPSPAARATAAPATAARPTAARATEDHASAARAPATRAIARPEPEPAARPAGGPARAGTATGPARPRLVPAVERAARLLDALAASRQPLSLADLARALGLPRSSVHGLLATLVTLDLARRNGDAEFSLGPKALQWADAYGTQSDVLRAFDDQVDRIPALGTETVMLATLEGADVVYLACRQGSRALAVNFRVGGRFPAAATSSGKAMLASLTDDAVRERVARAGLRRLTRHGVATLPALLRQLEVFRRQGWAVDDEETAEGMQCFGAAVFGARGQAAQAAVAVSVIKAGLTPRRRTELVESIGRLAAEMSAQLGAPHGMPPAASGRGASARGASARGASGQGASTRATSAGAASTRATSAGAASTRATSAGAASTRAASAGAASTRTAPANAASAGGAPTTRTAPVRGPGPQSSRSTRAARGGATVSAAPR